MTTSSATPLEQLEQMRGSRPVPRSAVEKLAPSRQRYPETIWSLADGVRALHLNEAPWPPSPRVIEAIARHAKEVFRYPMPQPTDLRLALAEHSGVSASCVVIGNGSDELVQAIALAYLDPGVAAVMPAPSFAKYRQSTRLMGADVVEVELGRDGRIDVERLSAACTPATRVVYVPTPNNPTGGYVAAEELQFLLDQIPSNILIVFDAAYHEFSVAAGGPDLIPLLQASSGNWIVLRSLSKAYCLAGMRIGYALAADDTVVEMLARALPVFNVTHLGRIAALAALSDQDHLAETVAAISAERSRLRVSLQANGIDVLPSVTNFLSVQLSRPASPVLAHLRKEGILVAPISDRGYETFLRVTIGQRDDNDRFLNALLPIMNLEGVVTKVGGRAR